MLIQHRTELRWGKDRRRQSIKFLVVERDQFGKLEEARHVGLVRKIGGDKDGFIHVAGRIALVEDRVEVVADELEARVQQAAIERVVVPFAGAQRSL